MFRDRWNILENTPGTAGGPGGRDRMLAVKSRKTGSIWQIGPGSMWQIGPGSIWQIGPGSMWQIGPGSMWQIKAILQGLRVAQAAVTERWP